MDRLYRKVSRKNGKPSKGLDKRDILADSSRFIRLIDHRSTCGIVRQLMEPWIQLSMAQALVHVTDPSNPGYVHTDGGQALIRIRVTETSAPLQIKIQYFLTAVRGSDRSNFVIFPASHHRPYPQNGNRPPPGPLGPFKSRRRRGMPLYSLTHSGMALPRIGGAETGNLSSTVIATTASGSSTSTSSTPTFTRAVARGRDDFSETLPQIGILARTSTARKIRKRSSGEPDRQGDSSSATDRPSSST